MNGAFNTVFVFSFIVISISFFGANFLDKTFINLLNFGLTSAVVFWAIPLMLTQKRGPFISTINLMVLSILVSIFMAYFTWGQSVKDCLIATIPFLLWPFFYVLRSLDFPVPSLEKIIIFLGLVYMILYFYQFTHPNPILFGKSIWGDEFIEDRGVIRIHFPGGGLFTLAVFIALNKFTVNQNHKWLFGLLILVGLVIPVMQATRVDVVGVFLIYIYHFINWSDIKKKILLTLICTLVAIYVTANYTNIKPLSGMVEAQEQNAKEGDKYIRFLAGEYFLKDFSPRGINKVLGNGVPYVDFSNYGKHVWFLNDQHGYFLEDIGIIAIYALYGIPGVLAYLLIWKKSFTIPLPPEYQYVKYYLWFLLFTGLTTSNLYYPYYLIATVICLYIYETVFEHTQRILRLPPAMYSQSLT